MVFRLKAKEERILAIIMLALMILVAALVWALVTMPRAGYGRTLPKLITRGTSFENESPSLDKFGIYSLHYMELRWQRMCKSAARYDAMREANDLGHTNPCY